MIKRKLSFLSLLGIGAWAVVTSSCSNSGQLPAPAAPVVLDGVSDVVTAGNRAPVSKSKVTPAPVRRGIATGFGRSVNSAMTYTDFVRASVKPRYVSTIHYNDSEGAREMRITKKLKGEGMQKAAGGLVEWGVASGWGMLDSQWWRGGRFVVGKAGREYELRLRNLSSSRLEVVLSVDGLDVIDGNPASTKKRGYILEPRQMLRVKGFRTSEDEVAAFKFSSVSQSYANLRHGNTRNVGVIGMALFTEKGREPGSEIRARQQAQPFAEAPMIRARN